MAARKGAGHTPGVAAHRCIELISFEIKIIQRNHLYGKAKSLGGSFNPLPKSGLSTSRQSTESEQTAFSLPLLRQAEKRQSNRPQPIRRRLGVPLIKGYLMTLGPALLSKPILEFAKFEMLKQSLLISVRNEALAFRIQL